MGTSWIRPMRRAIGLVWIALLVFLLALVGLTQLAPRLGHEVYTIRGGSMAPTIPLGSVVLVSPVAPADVAVGDVVTIKSASGVVYTHRVVDIVDREGVRDLHLKGDANGAPDGGLVPVQAVIGRVQYFAPLVGFALALLSMPSGVMSLMSLLGSLLLAYWLLEDREPDPELAAAPDTVPEPQVA